MALDLLGSGPDRLKMLNKKIVEIYEKQGVEAARGLRHLNLTDLADTGQKYPCLQHCKAAKIRWFTPVALELAKEFNSDRAGEHREAVVRGLHKVYTLLGMDWKEWDAKVHSEFKKAIEDFMAHYSWLANDALQKGLHLWSIVQKSHLLLHLAGQSEFMHPALSWTYGSESFMGWVVQIGSSCTSGTPAAQIPLKVLQKFRLVFHLFLKGYMCMEDQEG